jgi:unsaturated chondroitin disaccharide hydrolase
MAYQITGDEWFADVVKDHINSYVEREANRVGMDDHDIGFVFVPSCVGAYKVLGSETARDAALRAVDYFYETGYSKEGKFIIRAHKSWSKGSGCRTMIDSMMNSTLFFWANEEIGISNYYNAGNDHTNTTIDLILRDDGSTYHHYQFDPLTAEPVRGLTWQGYSDESCWSRGQSWAIYGFSIAYSYAKSSKIYDAQRDATYYMLNHLSSELIPCWDYTFKYEDVPKDSSAAAIAVCGMLDMASYLPENSAQRLVYESAAAQIMEALIDKCTTDIGVEYDGLIHSATHGVPQGLAIEECSPYADYFYLEALARYLKHDFIRPW